MAKVKLSDLNPVNTIYLIGVPLATFLLAPYAYSQGALTKGIIIYTLLHWFVDCYAITTSYHRCFSHKSFEMHPVLKVIFLVLGAGAMQNSALVWASDHRRHHSFEDTDADPYSINKGFFYAHWGWMFFKDPPDYYEKMPRDLWNDKWIAWQHKYYLPLAITMWLVVPTLVGWAMGNALGGFVFGGITRLFISTHCTFLINSAAHVFGKQTYSREITARDNWLLAFFTCGEGYHNFHHRFQNDYRNGHKWYHWDPTKWGITLYAKMGLAKNLRFVSDEKLLEARLQTQADALAQRGYIEANPKLTPLKLKIVSLQAEFRKLQESFKELNASGAAKSQENILQLQTKLKELRVERKRLLKNWREQLVLVQTQARIA